jgi:hypothetical protein
MASPLRCALALVMAATFLGAARPALAQTAPPMHPHQQVISANPFGLLLEFFNAEYERVVSQSSTVGIGGSMFPSDDDSYVNADVFWRFYPMGVPLDGWAFGAKAGVTSLDNRTRLGFGFDVNRSWLLGVNNNFYVGVGIGLKRLLGSADNDFDLNFIPTIRLVNIGIAF